MLSKAIAILSFVFLFTGFTNAQNAPLEVSFSETYELANVILALTPYGISDEWEVQKGTPYYEEVMTYFKPMQSHPLLSAANYSREKWDYYLAFRTDSYAFGIDEKGKISRQFAFNAQKGLQPFDDNLVLIQDFYEKSNFHAFYQAHLPYFNSIASRYLDYFMVREMQAFLKQEFGSFDANQSNLVVFSPLVNRMSCHRDIKEGVSADFSTLALSLILPDNGQPMDQSQRASDIHFLFTEMDHGYVNPVTYKNARLLHKKFNYKKWDQGSGYTESDCFNEYMTWAVYDLFSLKYFPEYAERINREWHFQNNTRGFVASGLFGEKLRELYAKRKQNEGIKDLYPAMLEWTGKIQNGLKPPVLLTDSIIVNVGKVREPIMMPFSETMHKLPVIDCSLFKMVDGQRQVIKVLELELDKTIFFQDKSLKIILPDLPAEPGLYGLSFNIGQKKYELRAENGAAAPCPTRFYIRVQ